MILLLALAKRRPSAWTDLTSHTIVAGKCDADFRIFIENTVEATKTPGRQMSSKAELSWEDGEAEFHDEVVFFKYRN